MVQLLFACEIIRCWPIEASIEEHRSATDDCLMSSLAVTDSYNQITALLKDFTTKCKDQI